MVTDFADFLLQFTMIIHENFDFFVKNTDMETGEIDEEALDSLDPQLEKVYQTLKSWPIEKMHNIHNTLLLILEGQDVMHKIIAGMIGNKLRENPEDLLKMLFGDTLTPEFIEGFKKGQRRHP
jgi:hypothetical protein